MTKRPHSLMVVNVAAAVMFSALPTHAQTATAYSGQAVAIRANAVGISLALADTGPLPATGGRLKTSLASVNVLGFASAEVLSSSTSGSGNRSQSQSSAAEVNLLDGLITADAVKSMSSATCGSGGQASTNGNAELVGLVVAGQPVVVVNPNVALSLPGGLSVIVNEQTSSPGGNSGSMTVNALHVVGPAIDIVVASAHSDITCSS